MMKKQRAEKLFEKYRNGTLTDQERLDLDGWYLHHARSAEPLQDAEVYEKRMKEMDNAFPFLPVTRIRKIKLWPRIAVAASLMIAVSFSLYFFKYKQVEKNQKTPAYNVDIKPGGNKAYLTLANGKRIALTDAVNGEIAEQSGVKITKATDGQIVYEVSEDYEPSSRNHGPTYNTIETPKGGQYQVGLPDGTKVWLNAASSLTYPASFSALKDRKVKLTGEAYFEVAKDKNKPFLVSTEKQTLEVLGTHFNVNSYPDEASTKTTLLEGAVKIITNNSTKILKPGQEADVTAKINISEVNTEEAIAWKNGYFRFDDEKLESVMRKIARWYDVEVSYQDESLKNELFAAVTTRFANVSGLLKMLEQTGDAKFNIEGGKIIISKKR